MYFERTLHDLVIKNWLFSFEVSFLASEIRDKLSELSRKKKRRYLHIIDQIKVSI